MFFTAKASARSCWSFGSEHTQLSSSKADQLKGAIMANDPDSLGFDSWHEGHPPTNPTTHRPGSWAKLLVMQERALRGEELHHPDDCKEYADYDEQKMLEIMSQETMRKNKAKSSDGLT